MDIRCKACSFKLHKNDVDSHLQFACCPQCHALRDLRKHFVKKQPKKADRANLRKKPTTIGFEQTQHEIMFQFPLLGKRSFWAFFLLLAWFALALCYGYLINPDDEEWVKNLIVIGFILHIISVLGLGYVVAVLFVNKRIVSFGRDEIRFFYQPMPWFQEKKVAVTFFKELNIFLKKKRTSSGNISKFYEIKAVSDKNKEIVLFPEVSDVEEALFLKQEIRAFYQEKIRVAKEKKQKEQRKKAKKHKRKLIIPSPQEQIPAD